MDTACCTEQIIRGEWLLYSIASPSSVLCCCPCPQQFQFSLLWKAAITGTEMGISHFLSLFCFPAMSSKLRYLLTQKYTSSLETSMSVRASACHIIFQKLANQLDWLVVICYTGVGRICLLNKTQTIKSIIEITALCPVICITLLSINKCTCFFNIWTRTNTKGGILKEKNIW